MKSFLIRMCCSYLLYGAIAGPVTDPFSPQISTKTSERVQEIQNLAGQDLEGAIALTLETESNEDAAVLAFVLGNLYFQNEQYEEAEEAYAQAVEFFPAFRSAKINLGRIYLIQEKPELTVSLYQELVRDGVADGETWTLLGHALMQESEPVAAESAYRQAWLLDLSKQEAKRGLLNSLLQQERYEEVRFLSKELLADAPLQKEYWSAKSHAELALGDHNAAMNSLEQARRLGQADPQMLTVLGELYLEQRIPEQAVVSFQQAVKDGAGGIDRQMKIVEVLLNADLTEEATAIFAQVQLSYEAMGVQEQVPYEGEVIKLNSRIQLQKGSLEAASDLLISYLGKEPMDGEALMMMAEALRGQGEWLQAESYLERATRIKGMEADALVQLAMLQVDNKQWPQAIQSLERAQVFEEQEQVTRYLQQLRRMTQ
ncbi:tetratricopeptide repeat protein [Kiritimatiellota bacterium B12222]|nr:tetratricopeptide repeat protein [Kiritimatiellota bacterium B12222]